MYETSLLANLCGYSPSQEQIPNTSTREIEPARRPETLEHFQIDSVEKASDELPLWTRDSVPKTMICLNDIQPFLPGRPICLRQSVVEESFDG